MSRDFSAQFQQPDPHLALVRAMAAGDSHALDELYTYYGPAILSFLTARLGNRQQAEEILQDVMLAAWRNAASFRGESSVRTWLLVIARNRATNVQRKHQPTLVSFDETFDAPSGDTEPIERMTRKSRNLAVRDAIAQLPPAHQEVLELVFYHQLTGPEVAEVLGINEGTVKSRLHRAKEALRQLLHQEASF